MFVFVYKCMKFAHYLLQQCISLSFSEAPTTPTASTSDGEIKTAIKK